GVKLTFPGTENVPKGEPSREVVVTVNRHYPTRLGTPVPVVVDGPASKAQLRALSRRIGAIDGIASPVPSRRVAPDMALPNFGFSVDADNSLNDQSQAAVRAIRNLSGPAPLLVSGYTAEFLDLKTSLGQNLPLVVGVIALTTLLLLFLLTG